MITVNRSGLETQPLFLLPASKLQMWQMLIINERLLYAFQADFAHIFQRRSGFMWSANGKQRNKTVGKRRSRFTQVTSCCPIWPGSPPRKEIEGNHSCCLTPPPPLLALWNCWGGVGVMQSSFSCWICFQHSLLRVQLSYERGLILYLIFHYSVASCVSEPPYFGMYIFLFHLPCGCWHV